MAFGPVEYVGFILFSSLICYFPFIYLFYQNRHIQPIVARHPYSILLMDVSLYLVAMSEIWIGIFTTTIPCLLNNTLSIFYPFTFILYDIRLLRILFNYKISENVNDQKKKKLPQWEMDWYVKHRWLIIPKNIKKFLLGEMIFSFLLMLIIFLLKPQNYNLAFYCTDTPTQMSWTMFEYFCVGVSLIVAGILAWKLRNCTGDAWLLKREVNIMGVVSIIGFLAYGCTIYNFEYPVASICVYLIIHCTLLTSTVYPYYLSTIEKQRIENKILSDSRGGKAEEIKKIELAEYLKTQEEYDDFMDYLKTEFSSENLLFWDQVEGLKHNGEDFDENTLKATLLHIHQQFIANNSPYLINIPSQMREDILSQIEKMENGTITAKDSITIFHSAQKNIYELMNTDSYHRYQNTSKFENRMTQRLKVTANEEGGSKGGGSKGSKGGGSKGGGGGDEGTINEPRGSSRYEKKHHQHQQTLSLNSSSGLDSPRVTSKGPRIHGEKMDTSFLVSSMSKETLVRGVKEATIALEIEIQSLDSPSGSSEPPTFTTPTITTTEEGRTSRNDNEFHFPSPPSPGVISLTKIESNEDTEATSTPLLGTKIINNNNNK